MPINRIQSVSQFVGNFADIHDQRFPLKQWIAGSEDLDYKDFHMVGGIQVQREEILIF